MRSNYVLWSDGLDYYVSKRIGTKHSNSVLEHFVSFHETERDAWRAALKKQSYRVQTLNDYMKRYTRKARGDV